MTSIRLNPDFFKNREVFVGIDVHKSNWTLTAICEGEIVYDGTIPADFTRLHSILSRFGRATVHTVYEAGSFGFSLHDQLSEQGYDSMVTPPSLDPRSSPVSTSTTDFAEFVYVYGRECRYRDWIMNLFGVMTEGKEEFCAASHSIRPEGPIRILMREVEE